MTDKSIKKIEEKVDKMYNALVGDTRLGNEGLVKKVNRHEKFINDQRTKWAKIYGGMGVIGVVWTLLLKFWDKIF